jgi:hypothetical protein
MNRSQVFLAVGCVALAASIGWGLFLLGRESAPKLLCKQERNGMICIYGGRALWVTDHTGAKP